MAHDTKIGWCDTTVNGSSGCDGCELFSPRAPGDATCYAKALHESRLAKSLPSLYGPKFEEVRMIPGRFAKAAAYSSLTGVPRPEKPWLDGLPRLIFVGDMGDFLSREVTDAFLDSELLPAIQSDGGRRHMWLLLTKRPSRLAKVAKRWGGLPNNTVAMTTITDQRTADRRLPQLLEVACRWRAISAEPLLGAARLAPWLSQGLIQWLIAGGESGPNARPMAPQTARALRDEAVDAGTCFFFKQWGQFGPAGREGGSLGKEAAGRVLDGRTWDQVPRFSA
jgi:protein gp37